VSKAAAEAIEAADELAVADISWFELAWLATHERITISQPVDAWLGQLAQQVHTMPVTPAIAATAVRLPASFPGDPADRLIYATAIENGWRLVTKDERLRKHQHPSAVTLW
jgi:PIN domain nuclease of toxin-antitoxin system